MIFVELKGYFNTHSDITAIIFVSCNIISIYMKAVGLFVTFSCTSSQSVNYLLWRQCSFLDTSEESSIVGGIIGGVIGGIAVLAIVMVGVLLAGVYLARRKLGDRNWQCSSMLPTNISTSGSMDLKLVDLKSSENEWELNTKLINHFCKLTFAAPTSCCTIVVYKMISYYRFISLIVHKHACVIRYPLMCLT